MNCFYHEDREAIGICVSCGRPICPECKVVLADKFHCNKCANQIFERATTTRELLSTAKPRPNWFARHLNWAAIISWAGVFPVLFVGGFATGLIAAAAGFEANFDGPAGYLWSAVFAACWLIPTNGWLLRKKGQSLWHLLWLILPFGWIVFLSLDNRHEVSPIQDSSPVSDKEEQRNVANAHRAGARS